MDIDQELARIADQYTREGYLVITHPDTDHLPEFAKDFGIDMLATRGDERVLIQVKSNRGDLQADKQTARYAKILNQHGWRFDVILVQPDSPIARMARVLGEPNVEQIKGMLDQAETLLFAVPFPEEVKQKSPGIDQALLRSVFIHVWAGFEAALRHAAMKSALRINNDMQPLVLIRELYAMGQLSPEDYGVVEKARQMRNEIVHGFGPPVVTVADVQTLSKLARHLLASGNSLKAKAV